MHKNNKKLKLLASDFQITLNKRQINILFPFRWYFLTLINANLFIFAFILDKVSNLG